VERNRTNVSGSRTLMKGNLDLWRRENVEFFPPKACGYWDNWSFPEYQGILGLRWVNAVETNSTMIHLKSRKDSRG